MRELPPSEFKFGNYGANIPFGMYMDKKKFIQWLKEQCIVGYCYCPEFKPQAGQVAVMIREEGDGDREYECWSHVPIEIFNLLNKS